MFFQSTKNFMDNTTMFREITAPDEDVVEVNNDMSPSYKVSEDVVHHSLEGGGQVAQSKEHDNGFKKFPVRSEGCLPLITICNVDVVSPPHIQLGEVPGLLQPVDQLLNECQANNLLAVKYIESGSSGVSREHTAAA